MVWGCEGGIFRGIDQGMSWSMAAKGSRGRRGRKSSEVMSKREKQTAFNILINGFVRRPALGLVFSRIRTARDWQMACRANVLSKGCPQVRLPVPSPTSTQ